MATKKQRRQQKKKNKKKIIKGVVLTESENEACWRWARMVTKQPPPAHLAKKRFHRYTCPVCKRQYCIDGAYREQYCDECYITQDKEKILAEGGIYKGCMTTHFGRRNCLPCGGTNERN